jgi:hypothetical protein
MILQKPLSKKRDEEGLISPLKTRCCSLLLPIFLSIRLEENTLTTHTRARPLARAVPYTKAFLLAKRRRRE